MKLLERALRGKKTLIFIDFEGTQFTHEIIAAGLYKVQIDEEGRIINEMDNGKLIYTKARSMIGNVVTKITSITEQFLKENGISWKETIEEIKNYIGNDEDVLFVCFGYNDPKMIIESCRYSKNENNEIAKEWTHNFFDFLAFISQYIRDDNGNTYSLVNYLKLYDIEPHGTSHNPLNDAIDLKNLYSAFINNPEICFNEYLKVLSKNKTMPIPIVNIVKKLAEGKDVTNKEFTDEIHKYLA